MAAQVGFGESDKLGWRGGMIALEDLGVNAGGQLLNSQFVESPLFEMSTVKKFGGGRRMARTKWWSRRESFHLLGILFGLLSSSGSGISPGGEYHPGSSNYIVTARETSRRKTQSWPTSATQL
jgi:hypothetical protein